MGLEPRGGSIGLLDRVWHRVLMGTLDVRRAPPWMGDKNRNDQKHLRRLIVASVN